MVDCKHLCRSLGGTDCVYLTFTIAGKQWLRDNVAKAQRNITVCVQTLRFLTEVFTNLTSSVNNTANVLVLIGSADIS